MAMLIQVIEAVLTGIVDIYGMILDYIVYIVLGAVIAYLGSGIIRDHKEKRTDAKETVQMEKSRIAV